MNLENLAFWIYNDSVVDSKLQDGGGYAMAAATLDDVASSDDANRGGSIDGDG